VIIDSSDDDDDEDDIESVEMNVGLAVASGQTRGVEMNVDQTVAPIVASGHAADFRDDDDDSDDSDASFTRLLKSLHVSKELVVKETEMEVVDDKDDEDDDDESVDESVERPPTAKELEEAGVEAGTAFNLDRSNDCILISSENTDASNCKQWPDFRIPVKLFQRLFDYQKVGVQWMAGLHENRIGAILADDMGLGKTFMTLTYLGGLMKAGTIRNALIVAPLSVLRAWENEAAKVLTLSVPNVKVQVLSSDIAANRRLQALQEALEWYVPFRSFHYFGVLIPRMSFASLTGSLFVQQFVGASTLDHLDVWIGSIFPQRLSSERRLFLGLCRAGRRTWDQEPECCGQQVLPCDLLASRHATLALDGHSNSQQTRRVVGCL